MTLKKEFNRSGKRFSEKSPSASTLSNASKSSKHSTQEQGHHKSFHADSVRRSRRYRMRKYINCTSSAYGGIQGQVVNVSEAGVMLRSSQPVDLESGAQTPSPLVLTVSFPGDTRASQEPVRMEAVPVWCSRSAVGEQYEMGLEWRRLSLPKRLMIKHWQRYCADVL